MKIASRNKSTVIIHTIPTILLTLAIQCSLSFGTNGSSEPVPKSEFISVLENSASLIKANFESIGTWQGEIAVQEDDYYYGKNCRLLPIRPADPAVDSNCIKRSVDASVRFAVDIKNDKLYTEFIPITVKYNDVDSNRPVSVDEKYSRIISIVTSDRYLSHQPDHIYAYRRDSLFNGKLQGKAAFVLPRKKADGEQWGHIRDPRGYFFEGKRTISDFLYGVRGLLSWQSEFPEGKTPEISMAIEERGGYRALLHVKGGFHGGQDCPDCSASFINMTATLDSSVGFNLVHREVTDRTGAMLESCDIAYETIGGVYVPHTVHFVILTGSRTLFDSRIAFSKSILNESIPSETFSYRNLGLEDGERLCDKICDIDYLYQNGNLIPIEKMDD